MIEMFKRFGVSMNILQANIEWIHHSPTGIMLAAVDADNGALDACRDFLFQHNITIEILGYVHRNVFAIT